MSWLYILLLILLGFFALILELLIIPGGIVGIAGLVSMLGGVVWAYTSYGSAVGTIVLVATAVIAIGGTLLLLRSRTWKKCELNTEIDVKLNGFDESKVFVGAVGETIGRLSPSGTAVFSGETVEVVSPQDFIDPNSEVVVTRIEGRKIFVKSNK